MDKFAWRLLYQIYILRSLTCYYYISLRSAKENKSNYAFRSMDVSE